MSYDVYMMLDDVSKVLALAIPPGPPLPPCPLYFLHRPCPRTLPGYVAVLLRLVVTITAVPLHHP